MRILVTGSNGLLGQKLTNLLQEKNDIALIATARSKSAVEIRRGKFITLDISDRAAVDSTLSNEKPEVVINTAAMTMVDPCEVEREACWKNNVLAVRNLINACRDNQTRLVHLSTDFIFDGSSGPLDETAIPSPVNFYGESKLAAENLISQSDIDWCIIRTVLVYGVTADMSRSNLVLWVKKSLLEGKSIRVVDDQFRTPTLAEDLAMGCYLAASNAASGVFHVSGNEMMTPYEMAIRTADFFNLDKTLIHPTDSASLAQLARRPARTGFIITKAQRELGFNPRSLDEGLSVLRNQMNL